MLFGQTDWQVSRKGIDCVKMDTFYGKYKKNPDRLAGIFPVQAVKLVRVKYFF